MTRLSVQRAVAKMMSKEEAPSRMSLLERLLRRLELKQGYWWGRSRLLFYTHGLGDEMIAREVGQEFLRFCEESGDPGWGRVVIAGGASPLVLEAPRGDLNLYWWWSMGGREDWLAHYLSNARTQPDAILCLSDRCLDAAQSAGLPALALPLGVGSAFRPLGLERRGVGYAGTRQHKDPDQMASIVRPVEERYGLDWVEALESPRELNGWYNRKMTALGMTDRTQEAWGMVNNRVFQALASGTPFVVHRHPTLEAALGFPYPYQSSSAEETLEWVEAILSDPPPYLEEFRSYSRRVRTDHQYRGRLRRLAGFLEREGLVQTGTQEPDQGEG